MREIFECENCGEQFPENNVVCSNCGYCEHPSSYGKKIDEFEGIPIMQLICNYCKRKLDPVITIGYCQQKYDITKQDEYRYQIQERKDRNLKI